MANKFFKQKGLVNIVTLVGMVVVSLVLPVVTKMVQQNQESRSQAVILMETDGGVGKSVNIKVVTPSPTANSRPKVLPKCSLKSGGYCAKTCSNGFYYAKGKSDCSVVSYCCKPKPTATKIPTVTKTPTPSKSATSQSNNQSGGGGAGIIDEEVSYICSLNTKRCNGNKLEACVASNSTSQIGSWSLVENCKYGCDDNSKLCKASCGLSQFLSNDLSTSPKEGLCRAGTVFDFGSMNDNNLWVWDCGGENLAKVSCRAQRRLLLLSLSETSLNLEVGESKKIQARLDPDNKDEQINWQSENGLMATVDSNGLIVAKDVGEIKIKVTTNKGRLATINLKVTKNTKKCLANGKNYAHTEGYCVGGNSKKLMICENGEWKEKGCEHGCSDGKCKAGCGLSIFFNRNNLDSPNENQLCSLGKPENIESEISLIEKPYSYVNWSWGCWGDDLSTVKCSARRAVYCDSKQGVCVSSGTECNREYNGTLISGTDDCQKKAMVCCQTNTLVRIKKINIKSIGILVVGMRKQIEYSLEPSNTTDKVLWRSSNSGVAKVDLYSGMVEAVGVGEAKITASAIGVEKKILNVKVVASESEICSNSNCGLCKSRNSCLATGKCFLKNSNCELPSSKEENFCKGKSGYYCDGVGGKVECDQWKTISWIENDSKCLAEMGCNNLILGKYICRDGGIRFQCVNKEGPSAGFKWLDLGKCNFGCLNGECKEGFKCDGDWSEKFDKNNKQVGNGIKCQYGCDTKTGQCLCSFGTESSQKRAVDSYACFNNSEYICRGDGFFEKVKDCLRCGKDKCIKYVPEDVNPNTEYQYRCQSNFFGGGFLIKYFKGTSIAVGDKIFCQWGCQNEKCNCRDNWNVIKKDGQMTCLNNSQYKCVSGNWKYEKDCFECNKNGECVQLDETNKKNQCQVSGGKCVGSTRECSSGKIISSVTTCEADKPICCQQTRVDTITNVVELKKCEMYHTNGPPPYNIKTNANHGEIRCDREHKNVDICDNGEIEVYDLCYKSCSLNKCIDF